jgi:adenylate cyclase
MKTVEAKSARPLNFSIRFDGKDRQFTSNQPSILVGRRHRGLSPDLDLSQDVNVSRRHARIWQEKGTCWIEDLGSKFGTRVNGFLLLPQTKHPLPNGSLVIVGDTELKVEIPDEFLLPPPPAATVTKEVSAESLDVTHAALNFSSPVTNQEHSRRFLDLVLELNNHTELQQLLPVLMQKVVGLISGARRGTLLLRQPENDALTLAAFVSDDEPAVSETLARRALTEKKGFIWRRNFQSDAAMSVQRHDIASGMYAPLICRGETLGVICVDSPSGSSTFSEEDLRLLLAAAHFAATAVANHQLQEGLRQNTKLLERLLTNFSPKLRATLLEKARQGRLRPGGEKSEVTILFSDIRDFTAKSAKMDAADIMEMLNDYLPALGQAIFQFDGTIDKFVGDAILAVFGSPEPDMRQSEKALRAAVAMHTAVATVSARRAARGETVCEIGIGIHCGEVLHGFIGAADRLEFTVIGDVVNRTSHLCNQAKAGEILITYEMYQRTFNLIESEKITVTTKKAEKFPAYRVKSVKSAPLPVSELILEQEKHQTK